MLNQSQLYTVILTGIAKATANSQFQLSINSLLFQISHIIREIRQFQQAPYRIEHQPKVSLIKCITYET